MILPGRSLVSRLVQRRRDARSASLLGEAADGIVPASDQVGPLETVPRPPQSYRKTALIIACALFMQHLDATVLATALPTMAREFGIPATGMSMALTSYLLAVAIFIPASGSVADRFGARRVFQLAIALFVTGSIASGLSNDLNGLAAARFVQGAGGAMMVPVGRLILLRTAEKRDLVSAMAWLSMPALIGPILGPPVGGLIVTYLDWRWIFWLNVPLGLLGIGLVGRFFENVRSSEIPDFDGLGFLLSGVTLSTLVLGLQLASRAGHGRVAAIMTAIGIVGAILYLRHARRTAHPLLDLSLLKVPTFGLSVAGGTLIRITQGAQPFLLPMMMQLAFGLSAAASGLITVATAIGSFVMKGAVRLILRRIGFRSALVVFGVLAPLAYATTGLFRPGWPWMAISAVLMLCGFLMSLQFTAYNTIAYDGIEERRMSAATSLYSTVQQIALSLGVCASASALTIATAISGRTVPTFDDFSVAIWSVVAVSLTAIAFNIRFARDAGREMSGHEASGRAKG